MDNLDIDVIRTALRWQAAGRRTVLGTVVRTWGSAPRPLGALMAIRDDGQIVGSVSGGCIEDDLIAQVREGQLAMTMPEAVKYGVGAEQARNFGLPCGGTVEIVLEPVTAQADWPGLLADIDAHRLVKRTLQMSSGIATRAPADGADALHWDGQTLTTIHGPQYRLLIIGGGQLSKLLAAMALPLDYHVIVCDPREEYREQWVELPQVEMRHDMPDDLVDALKLNRNSAVVALTHDPKLDDLALMRALATEAFYVGAIGSRVNTEARRARLLEFDVTPAMLGKLHGPIGLELGAKTPAEIALAIMAEMTAKKRGVERVGSKSVGETGVKSS